MFFVVLKQFRKAIITVTMMKVGAIVFFLYEDIPECALRDRDDQL
jgi:hypothetical protein